MEDPRDATVTVLRQRMLALMLFRHAYAEEPDETLLELLASEPAVASIEAFAVDGHHELDRLAQTMRSLSQDADAAQTIAALRREYMALFVGPQKIVAPFWESVYLDPRELLFLESTTDVRKRYEAEGCRIDAETREAEDGIAYELDFLAHLAERSLEAWCRDDRQEFGRLVEVQHSFENDHLLTWLPLFAERAKGARTDYLYPTLCAAVAAFIAVDAALLDELAETLSVNDA